MALALVASVHSVATAAPTNTPESQNESLLVRKSSEVQRSELIAHVDRVLAATSDRERLRAHADLLADTDSLLGALNQAVRSSQDDPVIRSVALWALGERGTPESCQSVRQATNDASDSLYMLTLAVAQGRCGDTTALRNILSQGTEFTRPRAAVVLGVLNETRALAQINSLAQAAQGTEFENEYVLARGLLGDKSTEETLRSLLNDRALHMHAAIALARLGRDYVVFDLQAATRSPESLLRWAATQVLTERRLPGSCEVLAGLSTDTDARVVGLSDGVMNTWRQAAETHWRKEGFNMEHFTERAYCP